MTKQLLFLPNWEKKKELLVQASSKWSHEYTSAMGTMPQTHTRNAYWFEVDCNRPG